MGALTEFLRAARHFGTKTAEATKLEMKAFKSSINSLDHAINHMPVMINKSGHMLIGGETVGNFNRILREGNLRKLAQMSNSKVAVTAIDTNAFQSIVKNTAEFKVKAIAETAAKNAKLFPQLNVAASGFARVGGSTVRSVAKITANVAKKIPIKTSLMIGSVGYVGFNIYEKVVERRGCFMTTTINNVTTSCKVQAYSCIGNSTGELCTNTMDHYNVTLVLMQLAKMDDTSPLKISVCSAAGVLPADMDAQLASIIDNKYAEVSRVIAENSKVLPTIELCTLTHPAVENGKVMPCRMCSSTVDPKSTMYLDPSQYGDNFSFICNSDPTMLDVVADIILSTGKNILEGVSTTFMYILKPFLIVVMALLGLVIVIGMVRRMFANREGAVLQGGSTLNLFRNEEAPGISRPPARTVILN